MSSVCALCQREKALVRSHVIPEFLYREMYDDKHRFHVISTNAPGKHKLLQKGVRERLLCRDCENVLSISERYVNLVFTGKLPVKTHRSGQLYEIQGLDYRKFRLFGLSVLWRASVASHRFFRAVNLGPHESAIRQMILAQDPGPPNRYGFFLAPLVVDDKEITDLIIDPTRSRLDGHLCYRFVFGGLIWVFVVSSHAAPKPFQEAFINKEGRMLMLVSDLREVGFIRRAFSEAVVQHHK